MKGQSFCVQVVGWFLFFFLETPLDSLLSAGHPARFPWIIPSFITSIDFICTIHLSSTLFNAGCPVVSIALLVHSCFPCRSVNLLLFGMPGSEECQNGSCLSFHNRGRCINLGRFRAELVSHCHRAQPPLRQHSLLSPDVLETALLMQADCHTHARAL